MKYLEPIAVSVATIAVVALIGWVITAERVQDAPASESSQQASSSTTTATTTLVNLYYYSPENDIDNSGQLLCSAEGLVAIPKRLSPGDDLPERTLALLLEGELADRQREQGITTEFPLPGVALVGLTIRDDGTAVVALDDPQFQTSGGSCRATVLRAQVAETVQQFPEIAAVEFVPQTLFQP